jgi:branched-chain amino acid transport system ATP-binding protein
MLQVKGINAAIEAVEILRGFSIDVPAGQMVGLIGRNGAGKTSLMRSMMGHLALRGGTITLRWPRPGRHAAPSARRPGHRLHARGPWPGAGADRGGKHPGAGVGLENPEGGERLAFVYSVLPEMKEMRERRALLLSGGQQKLVALGRALAVGTRLLLLDEPFEGVAPALSQRLSEVIGGLRGSQLSVLISQSDLNHSTSLLDAEVVIERGANVAREAA